MRWTFQIDDVVFFVTHELMQEQPPTGKSASNRAILSVCLVIKAGTMISGQLVKIVELV